MAGFTGRKVGVVTRGTFITEKACHPWLTQTLTGVSVASWKNGALHVTVTS